MEDSGSGCMNHSPVKRACKYCSKVIVDVGCNDALLRHLTKCAAKINQGTEPMKLMKSSIKSNYMISYDNSRSRQEVVDFIVMNDMPFSFSKDKCFEDMLRKTFCPTFTRFSESATRNHVLKQFKDEKNKLLTFFNDFDGKVCLTSNLWTSSSCQKLQYLSLTAHYTDQNWISQKRVISFKLVETPYTGLTLGEALKEAIVSWGLRDKIFSLTLDNAKYNESIVQCLKEVLDLPLTGNLFHLHCFDRVLHLIVKDGLDVTSDCVEKIRNMIVSINSSDKNIQLFKDACKKAELPYKKLPLDVCTRLNASYTMLKVALEYRTVIDLYYFGLIRAEEQPPPPPPPPTDEDWLTVIFLKDFLALFDGSANSPCGMDSSYSRVLDQFFNLFSAFKDYETVKVYSTVVEEMKISFKRYWREFPMTIALAIIMDPRYKVHMIKLMHEFVYGDCFSSTRYISMLRELYEEYKCRAKTDSTPEKMQESSSCGKVYGITRKWKRFQTEYYAAIAKNELQHYLDAPLDEYNEGVLGPFDVLVWWKEHKHLYPVLSAMARDLLIVPVSTIASKAIFSAGDRLVSDYYTQLNPEMVEALICTKDWLHADAQGEEEKQKASGVKK